jgi:pyruvate formate lyase activating enzyme
VDPLDPPVKGVEFQESGHWSDMPCVNVFLAFCNLRCPWCNAGELVVGPQTKENISPEDLFDELQTIKNNHPELKAVCFTGGEPTMHRGLPDLLRRVRAMGLETCVETNGTQPHLLNYVITSGFLNRILFDLKAPIEDEAYSMAAGVPIPASIIKESLIIIKKMETGRILRTTVAPDICGEQEILLMASQLKELGFSRLALHGFVPGETLDPDMKDLTPYTDDKIKRLQGAADAVFS